MNISTLYPEKFHLFIHLLIDLFSDFNEPDSQQRISILRFEAFERRIGYLESYCMITLCYP